MIKTFKHKGLEDYYFSSSTAGIIPSHAKRITERLQFLDAAHVIDDMDKPGYKLHRLSGRLKGQWSISVSGNWRIFFKFENGHAYIINYGDYH